MIMKILMTHPSILFCFLLILSACSQKESRQPADAPLVAPEKILGSYANLWNYQKDYLRFGVPYTAYDTALQEISRERFMEAYASGKYLPLRIGERDSSVRYRLYRLPDQLDRSIAGVVGRFGKEEYAYYKKEGRPYPVLDFRDINGQLYNKETTAGKTLVLKFWFIHCGACVKEMPEVNKIREQYGKRDDVLFLSFAFDKEEELRAFMKKTAFNYAVISVPESYMEKLEIRSYPTHIIVGKNGNISKVTGRLEELADALKTELSKNI